MWKRIVKICTNFLAFVMFFMSTILKMFTNLKNLHFYLNSSSKQNLVKATNWKWIDHRPHPAYIPAHFWCFLFLFYLDHRILFRLWRWKMCTFWVLGYLDFTVQQWLVHTDSCSVKLGSSVLNSNLKYIESRPISGVNNKWGEF